MKPSQEIKKKIDKICFQNNNETKRSKLITSSNLFNFLPSVSSLEYDKIYKKILFNIEMALEDEKDLINIDNIRKINFEKQDYKSKIFCTFHYGSYRLICHILSSLNINYKLVIAEKTLIEQGEKFKTLFDNLKKTKKLNNTFSIINAESKKGFFEMIETLRKGHNLLFFIDGNTGVEDNKKNLIKIHLLENTFYSRKGISYLSILTKSSIIPIIMDKYYNKNQIIFYDEINTLNLENNLLNQEKISQKIYSILEKKLIKRPELWEGWRYFNKFIDINNLKLNSYIKRNQSYDYQRYIVEEFQDEFYLYDRYKYSFTPIDKEFYDSFQKNVFNFSNQIKELLLLKEIYIE